METEVTYPALTVENTKEEIVKHLLEVHHHDRTFSCAGNEVHNKNTKATKAELLSYHDRQHRVLDNDARTHDDQYGRMRDDFWFAPDASGFIEVARVPVMDHVHTESLVSEELRAKADAVRDNRPVGDKPLSVTERKVLSELINNDFMSLKSEMQAFSADSLLAKRQEINAEWAERVGKTEGLVGKANEMSRKHAVALQELKNKQATEMEALVAKAKEDGIQLSVKSNSYTEGSVYEADVIGRREALTEAEKDNKRFLDRALLTLEKQRLDAQRRVLVSGVTREAAGLLDTIPTAKTMMIEASQAEADAKAIESTNQEK